MRVCVCARECSFIQNALMPSGPPTILLSKTAFPGVYTVGVCMCSGYTHVTVLQWDIILYYVIIFIISGLRYLISSVSRTPLPLERYAHLYYRSVHTHAHKSHSYSVLYADARARAPHTNTKIHSHKLTLTG